MNVCSVSIKIATNLTSLMKSKNLSLRELSKQAGIPYTTLQEWTANRTPRNPVQFQKVANVLGVTMHFLLFGKDDPQEPIQKILKDDFFSGTFEISIKKVRIK